MGDTILIIGSGGREHALTWKLSQSPLIAKIKVAPGNVGTSSTAKATNIALNIKNHKEVISYCKGNDVKLVVVGPEDPLANGLADDLISAGIPCFGPGKDGAQIEASKAFSKDFMDKHNIPTAKWKSFQDAAKAKEYIENADFDALVVKASGLAAGKGVVVAANKEEAIEAAESILKDKKFGDAGNTIVVEELLIGEEISVLAFTDGNTVAVMPPAQDHKRALDGDKGPNTGGMGAYCPCPLVSDKDYEDIKTNVMQRTIDGLTKDGIHYVGVLFGGLMLTKNGPKVLEFNCRFGDPETESLLPLLNSDLYPTLLACTNNTLSFNLPEWKEETKAVNVVMVSGGYPDAYPKGKVITGLDTIPESPDLIVFHAGTAQQGNSTVTSGGRVLVAVGLDKTLESALSRATSGVEKIKFEGAFYRKDIAHKALRYLASTNANLLTYKSSGVDIEAGELLVNKIKSLAASTNRSGMASSLGGFGGVFDLKACGYQDPLLVSGTDGVGTKLKVAQTYNKHDTVGIDLVAMCVNDILTQGAEPLFFLDYFGCGKLHVDVCRDVVAGVAEGCRQSNASLIGGETAEMPGMYPPGEYDLAGFAVGAVERSKLLPDFDSINEGDDLIGIPSSGVHSNGFSLLRKIAQTEGLDYNDKAPFDPTKTLGDILLIPTKIYVKPMLGILQLGLIKAAAHITGGGILDNIPRVLPKGFGAVLDAKTWNLEPVYQWIANSGRISSEEMLRSFNCGLGMVLVVQKSNTQKVLNMLKEKGENPSVVGQVVKACKSENLVKVKNFKVSQKVVESKIRRKVGVLISGSGTNLQSLIDHTQDPGKNSAAEIVLVISNIASAAGLNRAEKARIPTLVISHKNYKSRVEFDMAIHKALVEAGVEIVCLAGFMRIVSEEFVRKWHGALLNVHPSLLPSFRGIHAHRQVLEAGVKVTGCTVHFVEVDVDTGGIIMQDSVQVLPKDTEEILGERVKMLEHKLYPQSLELLASGKIKLSERNRVEFFD